MFVITAKRRIIKKYNFEVSLNSNIVRVKLARQLYRNAQNQELNRVYILFTKFSRGQFLLNRKVAINKVLSPFTKILDAAFNKIFKKRDFNFFKKLNSKKLKISS